MNQSNFKQISGNSWKILIRNEVHNTERLVELFEFLLQNNNQVNIKLCRALEQIENANLRTAIVDKFGGWRIIVDSDEVDIEEPLQNEHIELKAVLLCNQVITKTDELLRNLLNLDDNFHFFCVINHRIRCFFRIDWFIITRSTTCFIIIIVRHFIIA